MLYPIGIQTFSEIINGGYVYVDKTSMVYDLVKRGKYYFLSRPRRFGKSLLLSTLESYFQGEKELFRGLAIESLEKEWIRYPVLHFDMNIGEYDTSDGVSKTLDQQLSIYEKEYGLGSTYVDSPSLRFKALVDHVAEVTGKNVVILIDEYEKPVLEAQGDRELEKRFRGQLKPFYGVLKTCDRHIRFAMLTGVSRLGKMSVFSDLNNLMDISMDDVYSTLCGITKSEIEDIFANQLAEFAFTLGISIGEVKEALRLHYDGYLFAVDGIRVFNPFSLLQAFSKKKMENYWFSSGTPSFLIRILKKEKFNLWELDRTETSVDSLVNVLSFESDPIPLLYQCGYLTIKSYDEKFKIVTLGYPNEEVRQGFIKSLLPFFTDTIRAVRRE